MSGRGVRDGWALFVDWCSAVGAVPAGADDALLARFVADLSYAESTRRRLLRQVLRRLAGYGIVTPAAVAAPDRLWREPDDVWDTLPGALARVEPQAGWPRVLRERRDGWVLVLAGHQWTRRGITRLTPAGVTVGDVAITLRSPQQSTTLRRGEGDPAECAACAITRWLRIVDSSETIGRGAAQQQLAATEPGWHLRHHDCLDHLPGRWREAYWLTVRVTKDGWLETLQPLTPRSVTAIVSERQPRSSSRVAAFEPTVRELNPKYDGWDWDELDDEMDRICAAADEVLARVEAALRNDAR